MKMLSQGKRFKNTDEYIASFPKNVQDLLQELRKVIRESVPEAEETISYGMPAFKFNGILVYFAAFKDHIGFYPTSSAILAFKKELSPYSLAKGTVRFPIGGPIPFDIVRRIVEFRAKENEARIKKKKKVSK